jgi:hypothetical protein
MVGFVVLPWRCTPPCTFGHAATGCAAQLSARRPSRVIFGWIFSALSIARYRLRASGTLIGLRTQTVHLFRMAGRLAFRMKNQIRRKQMLSDSAATQNVGWRSSADGPLLCPFSLVTGNFTGNFAKLRLLERRRPQIMTAPQAFDANSLLNRTGNYFVGTGIFEARTGNFIGRIWDHRRIEAEPSCPGEACAYHLSHSHPRHA